MRTAQRRSAARAHPLRRLKRYLPYLVEGLRHSLQDMGIRSAAEVHERLYDGRLRFELRSPSSQVEGGVHDLHSYTRKDFS